MAEVFKVIGVIMSTLIVDALVCFAFISICDAWEDDDLWIFPLVINLVGFVAAATILICEKI